MFSDLSTFILSFAILETFAFIPCPISTVIPFMCLSSIASTVATKRLTTSSAIGFSELLPNNSFILFFALSFLSLALAYAWACSHSHSHVTASLIAPCSHSSGTVIILFCPQNAHEPVLSTLLLIVCSLLSFLPHRLSLRLSKLLPTAPHSNLRLLPVPLNSCL